MHIINNIHVNRMRKIIINFLVLALLLLFVSAQEQDKNEEEEQNTILVNQLNEQLQNLDQAFSKTFLHYYYGQNQIHSTLKLNITRVNFNRGAFLLLIAKMYLYDLSPVDQNGEAINQLNTSSRYLAAYYYFKISAEQEENAEAWFYLGLLEHYKLVPQHLMEKRLSEVFNNSDRRASILSNYLKSSHIYNIEHSFYMSSMKGFDPSSLVLGFMNKNRINTKRNCTAALSYYLSVLKHSYIDTFIFKHPDDYGQNFEDLLYTNKTYTSVPCSFTNILENSQFIQHSEYYDVQNLYALLNLADNFYLGRNGYLKNLTRAASIYQKLAKSGEKSYARYAKVLLGLMYFKGEGVEQNRQKAKLLFQEVPNQKMSQYMLIAMKYFGIEYPPIKKQQALTAMLSAFKKHQTSKEHSLSVPLAYLIGAVILKGQLAGVDVQQGYNLLDKAAMGGSMMAKVLLGILFTDGAAGLKYGCNEAIKYFSQQSADYPFFKDQISRSLKGMRYRRFTYSLIKYLIQTLTGNQLGFINSLYLLTTYPNFSLKMNSQSWSLSQFTNNQLYKQLKIQRIVPDIESKLLKSFTVLGKSFLNYNLLRKLMQGNASTNQHYYDYIYSKIILIGSSFEKKNILKWYEYKMKLKNGQEDIQTLTALTTGNTSKNYVSEARYLLAKYNHKVKMNNKTQLTVSQKFKIKTQYSRAIKSQMIGQIIYFVQDYRLRGDKFDPHLMESRILEDLGIYTFVLAIIFFILYYKRSKRIDQIHLSELKKIQEKKVEEMRQERLQQSQKSKQISEVPLQQVQIDNDQPIITEDQDNKGVRIGSSYE